MSASIPVRDAEGLLTQEYARYRSARVSEVEYELEFDLDGHSREFLGLATVRFTLSDKLDPITVDFTGATIDGLRINGRDIEAPDYNGWFITVPPDELRRGPNSVIVRYRQPYRNDGAGLHRFTDPEDGRVYLHTHFEPYDANRAFPCFDQPDLKASFTLKVKAPKPWIIVSALPEADIQELSDGKLWTFPKTPRFSTYIFPLHGGQYRSWEAKAGKIPLRLFARHSMAKHVNPDDWFDFTRKGMEFFQAYFDMPYPYEKYDQLIVPEFNIGGMENVAAVTYNERYVKRGGYSAEEREAIADVMLHELSHMWFGDLVTPDWWSGLWLKESFATYMGTLAQASATEFQSAWHTFFSASKQKGYEADQWPTTHPVDVPVEDTKYAFAHFDAITYQKGAAVLTQLAHYVGQDRFRDGVRLYLKRHAGGATELKDFISAVTEAAGKPLDTWEETWLRQAGLNTLKAGFACRGDRVKTMSIEQSCCGSHPTLREHRIQLGTYNIDKESGRVTTQAYPITVSGKQTRVADLEGEPCPDLVFPNHGDWGYIKVELDELSLEALKSDLGKFKECFVKSMFWQTLWDMARDAKLPLTEYAELLRRHLPGEEDRRILRQVNATAVATLDMMFRLQPASSSCLQTQGAQLESLAWTQLHEHEAGSDLQKLWLDAYTSMAHTNKGLDRLRSLLDERNQRRVKVDQDKRWQIVARLNEFDFEDAEELAEIESSNDGSDAGQRMFIATLAGRPDMEMKQEWVDELQLRRSPLPLARKRAAMLRLFPAHQKDFHVSLSEEILASLPDVSSYPSDAFLSSYSMLIPVLGDQTCADQLQNAISTLTGLHPILEKRLRVAEQENARQMAIGRLILASTGKQAG